ncbi:flavin reductase family protein [Deinococcus arcticus]|uniref:Flavoredoxin n=1 Tax=Deinococcus arcticus TaxID=2136176 RepID=A0A2T3W7D1_9DEIO|nr:flavin reductase family protein [Deinococcus arcticus]PTA67805.1 flavoredoxin [Deinococcus arcticus]
MLREVTDRFFGYYPGTVALVTAAHGNTRNVMAAGWHTALSAQPPLYGVAVGQGRATHLLILGSGSFGVNFLPLARAGAVQGSGTYSLHGGHDKHALLALPTLDTQPLALQGAYLHYTCRVTQVLPTGDHDLIVGEVQAVHYDPDAYDAQGLLIAPPAIYLGRSVYTTTAQDRVTHGP